MLVFKVGGKGSLPPVPEEEPRVLKPPPATASAAEVSKGEKLFQRYCAACHGDVAVSGGVLSDLRYSSALSTNQLFSSIVLGGLLRENGMVSFAKELRPDDANAIRSYVIFRAHQTLQEEKSRPDKNAENEAGVK